MDITEVEEQGDGGDESHQGSPKTSLSPKIVALGHVADRPIIVYDSDGKGLEDHGVPPPPFLEGSSSTPLTLIELLDSFFIVEDLRRNWAAAQQLRELFDTAETLYYKFYHFCIEKAMFQPYKLAHTRFMPSCILESTIDAGGPHAKSIMEGIRQILRLEGATYWHPRMPVHSRTLRQEKWDVVSHRCTIATLAIAAGEVPDENDRQLARRGLYEMDLKACMSHIWNALNQLRGASSLKEEGNQRNSMDSIIENPAITNYNAVLESRLTELGEGYEQAMEACVAAVVWHYLFIKPNDFGENFRSWIVDIIQDMSPKELSKFLHFAVDSPEFRPREPIWIQIEK
ncbi:hypothetical protein SELMODRAFT_404486 [Selaginella moellendorffii]|uniref:Uncharacterized protein n=1 Tax=Selaginella moellendorffii TaxID=88036 RepID=D8QVH6_SELML|nr:hypothetical protein SELMODRAFT_404486 [Selaginella moellendorffii]